MILKKRNKIIAAALIIVSVSVGFGSGSSKAAQANRSGITVSPFLQTVQIGSEASKDFNITYTNESSQPQKLALSVADFGSLDQSGGVAFVGNASGRIINKHILSPWLSLSANEITLTSHQKTAVTATILNDSGMGPGGHYAAVIATVLAPDSSDKNQVSLKQKITSLVFAVKTGGEKYDLKLQNIDSNRRLFKLPSEVDITIRATGNTHVVPRGIVYLKNKSGRVIARGVINQESGYVLPDSTRIFRVQLNKIAPAKLWDTTYSLQVDYRYDGIDKFATKTTSIHYINLPVILVLILLLTGVIYFIARNMRQKQKTVADKHK